MLDFLWHPLWLTTSANSSYVFQHIPLFVYERVGKDIFGNLKGLKERRGKGGKVKKLIIKHFWDYTFLAVKTLGNQSRGYHFIAMLFIS